MWFDIPTVLNKEMKSNFSSVDVQVVMCPDLTKEPFTLASKGLGGQPRLIELGGVPYLMPVYKREKLYDIKDVAKLTEIEPAFIIGPSMGSWSFRDTSSEMAVNVEVKNGNVSNHSRITWLDKDEKIVVEQLPDDEPHCGLVGNLLCCQGTTDKVSKCSLMSMYVPNHLKPIQLCLEPLSPWSTGSQSAVATFLWVFRSAGDFLSNYPLAEGQQSTPKESSVFTGYMDSW
ncbi:hypothetical protein PR048_024194 [Dryococelus australis]|uniref:DUF1907 domain-containing protein n=1 Tax=Dryococelus australis TaxID=614101 RepID=A0ABQ9GW98_9NEOP|nr:hypothetical protein PR048_024194 [Dryococelus australis]